MLEYYKNENTGNLMRELTYSPADLGLVRDFIKENYKKTYTLLFYDRLTGKEIKVNNEMQDIGKNIDILMSLMFLTEHTYVNWIGLDRTRKSYVISIDMNNGELEVGHTYHYDKKAARLNKVE